MNRGAVVLLAVIAILIVLVILLTTSGVLPLQQPGPAAAVLAPSAPFTYSFKIPGVLHESGSMHKTTSPYWWVNSGGTLVLEGGIGMTIQGTLPPLDRWRVRYALSNPADTDNGTHPQNIFRLVSRSRWHNPSVEAGFFIVRDNLSDSTNRNESNGLLLMSRYQNNDTLYYAGVRVDGRAVIKKKYCGTYYTMAEKSVFDGTYDTSNTPNLLPHGEWLLLRSETRTTPEGVHVSLLMRQDGENEWRPLLTALDDGKSFGGTPAIQDEGFIGIRTDFMDVQFRTIHVEEL